MYINIGQMYINIENAFCFSFLGLQVALTGDPLVASKSLLPNAFFHRICSHCNLLHTSLDMCN